MRICLVQPPRVESRADSRVERLAALLSGDHEVVVVDGEDGRGEATSDLGFASEEHRRSALVLERIRDAYGSSGPDYLEVHDAGARGLVALQARLAADPLLRDTVVGVRIGPSLELRALHDRKLSRPRQLRTGELEREQFRLADRLIWPGGDTLGLYRRYYSELDLPEALRIRPPVELVDKAPPAPRRDPHAPLRILYAGELRYQLGVLDLVEACLLLENEDWRLTIAGPDTATATMGQSVRLTIEAMVGEDPRVQVEAPIAVSELPRRLAEHDLLVAPSRVDGWNEMAIGALGAGLPVLATPVGGLTEIVVDGVSGWHSEDLGADALRHALERLLGAREELERLRCSGPIAEHARQLTDPAPIFAGYQSLAAGLPRRGSIAASRVGDETLITGIVTYYRVSEHVAEAVASLLDQTHRRLEVLIVNDGSFDPADAVLAELESDPRVRVVTQLNRGESAARNFGACLARGEYLLMLDSDNALEPEFAERALAAFAREPDLAYVTTWLRAIDVAGEEMPADHGYAPLGNAVIEGDSENWDGDTIAMFPRRLFAELGYHYGPDGSMHSDWELYRWLRADGRFGAVIPERLARYRIRPGSLLRAHGAELRQLGWEEARDRNRLRQVRWIAER